MRLRSVVGAALAVLLLSGSFATTTTTTTTATTTTLVLLDDTDSGRASHAGFFAALRARGHALRFALADAVDVRLSAHGVNAFDNLVLFAPAAEDFLGTLDAGPVAAFVRQGGNVLAAAASSDQGAGGTSWLLHELAAQCGVVLGEDGTHVVVEGAGGTGGDHEDGTDGSAASTFKTSQWTQDESGSVLMAGSPRGPILYRGIALAPADPASRHHMTILSAPAAAYSVDASGAKVDPFPRDAFKGVLAAESKTNKHRKGKKEKKKKKKKKKTRKKKVIPVGESTPRLVLGVEAQHSGARVVFLGSMDMCADAMYDEALGNEKFCDAVGAWAFQEVGVVRASGPLRIAGADGQENKALRRFHRNDTVVVGATFDMDAAAASIASSGAAEAAVQLELVQAGRVKQTVAMREDPARGKGAYRGALTFREADAYGVFQLRVVHRRMGFTTVDIVERVVVAPAMAPQRLDVAIGIFCVIFAALYALNHHH
jgi:hypothetical protein